MKCLCCGQKVGLVRRLAGMKFCCADHQKRYRARSARALRDVEDQFGDDEWSSNAVWRSSGTGGGEKSNCGPDQKTTLLGLIGGAFLVIAIMAASDGSGGSARAPLATYSASTAPVDRTPGLVSRLFHGGSTALQDDFHRGLSNWVATHSDGGWSTGNGYVRPAALRLWKPSLSMSNYEFEFVGQIQRNGMSWAFRAPDVRNYYATKLTLNGPASQPNAGLVRFVVLGGRECERVELPLPMALSRATDYHISMSVRGSRFLTSINGQLVSSWTDSRIGRGGVGFFAEGGDMAAVKWATLSERDGVLGRLASYFSLWTFSPAAATP